MIVDLIIDIYRQVMENEDYAHPRTPKMFISTVTNAFQHRDGHKLAQQLREIYFAESYLNTPEKNWKTSLNSQAFSDSQGTLGSNYARMLELIKDYAQERAGKRWAQCFQKHMQVLVTALKVLEEMKQMKPWLAKSLLVVIRATKRVFLICQQKVSNSSTAAKLKNSLFNTLQRFKTSKSLDDLVRRQFLSLVDVMQVSILLFFHSYEQLQRILYSNKNYGDISDRYVDNFMFQKGKYSLINQNFGQAEQCLLKINPRTKGQRKLIMRYLIPCRIFLGKLYQPTSSEDQFSQYSSIIEVIKTADFSGYDELSKKYQKLWLKRGIYLLMDRIRIILWRTLVKRLFLVVGNQIDMEVIQKAVKCRGGSQNINECICIVANLIYQGYIKGYIFQSETRRTLVLKSTGNPFPKLQVLAK